MRTILIITFFTATAAGPAVARDRWFSRKPYPPAPCVVAPHCVVAAPCVSAPPVTTTPAPVAVEKMFSVNFDAADWKQVFAWLAKETNKVFLSTTYPTGTLTLKSDAKFTGSQLFDLLDEVLEQKGWMLIAREHSFMIHPTDTKIPRELLAQVTVEELPKFGGRSVVQVVLKLNGQNAEDVAPQARKLLGAPGEITVFGKNQLIVIDRVKNIRNICKFLEVPITENSSVVDYECKFVRADQAARRLLTLLEDSITSVSIDGVEPVGAEKRPRSVSLAVDSKSNRLTISGSSAKKMAAEALLKEIDQSPLPRPIGEPIWKTYEVTRGTNEAVAQRVMASPRFKGSTVKTLVIGDEKIMVFGTPGDHADIVVFWSRDRVRK